jgi:hypothetical protein
VGTVAAALVGTINPAGAPDQAIRFPSPETAVSSPAAATLSMAQRGAVITANNASSGPPRVANINTGGPFAAALTKLDALPIKGRAPKTGYNRDAFGVAWADDVNVEGGHNGCDTRNDILRRDLTGITIKPGSRGCTVLSGMLIDPYTGRTIPFNRGADTSTAVQIDHVVALADAWQKGAQELNQQIRQDFANDPRNLQATDGAANEQKRDGDAATWLPPNKGYRCTYVSRQVEVKAVYGLWVTQAEHDAIANLLIGCADAAASPAGTVPQANGDPEPAVTPPPARPDSVEPLPSATPIPDPARPSLPVVHPGAFCASPGAQGVSSSGKPMVCAQATDGRLRWRSANR